MKLEFQSKHPHRSRFLVIEYNSTEDPALIISVLVSLGWEITSRIQKKENILTRIHLSKKGNGLFNSWTTKEHSSLIKEAEKALKTIGFVRIPYRKLTIQDCI